VSATVRNALTTVREDPVRAIGVSVGAAIAIGLVLGFGINLFFKPPHCQGDTLRVHSRAVPVGLVRPAAGCVDGVLDYAGHLWQQVPRTEFLRCDKTERTELLTDGRVSYSRSNGEVIFLQRIPGDRYLVACG